MDKNKVLVLQALLQIIKLSGWIKGSPSEASPPLFPSLFVPAPPKVLQYHPHRRRRRYHKR